MKRCYRFQDRVLCDVLDDAEMQFWPPEDGLSEASGRLGRAVGREEVERVEACLLAGRWVPSRGWR